MNSLVFSSRGLTACAYAAAILIFLSSTAFPVGFFVAQAATSATIKVTVVAEPTNAPEYFEVAYTDGSGGLVALNLNGWQVQDFANNTYTFGAVALEDGDTYRVCQNAGTTTDCDTFWNISSVWNNGGDTFILHDDNDETILSFTFGDVAKDEVITHEETLHVLGGLSDSLSLCHFADEHASSSYVLMSQDISSFFTSQGHSQDTEDIIPPFYYEDGDGLKYFSGNNWDNDRQVLWENDCTEDVVVEVCSEGYTGVYPDCIPPIEECFDGYTGVYPDCVPSVVQCLDNGLADALDVMETVCAVPPALPVDVCTNLEGNQTQLPEGYELTIESLCVPVVPEVVFGCTDPSATNYNVTAIQGSEDAAVCTYQEPQNSVLGCTDITATNYNAEATEGNAESAVCTFPQIEQPEVRRSGGSSRTRVGRLVQPAPQVLGVSTTKYCPFIDDYMQIGWDNNQWEVTKLQLFLNSFKSIFGGVGNPVTGVFDTTTDANVKAFQGYFHNEVLKPWFEQGIVSHERPTGFVYKTTRWKINDIVCHGSEAYPSLAGETLMSNIDTDGN